MSLSVENTSVYISSVLIGHGNPVSAIAINEQAIRKGYKTRLDLITSFIGSFFHGRISKDPDKINDYSSQDNTIRTGFRSMAFGILMSIEILRANPELLSEINPFKTGIFTQDLMLNSFSRKELEVMFPEGTYLFAPDVHPKNTSEDLIKNKGVIPVVWNKDAYDQLKDQGLEPILVSPWLPNSLIRYDSIKPSGTKIIVKSSGTGMPEDFIKRLKSTNSNVEFVLPDRKKTVEQQATDFYNQLVDDPPGILISFPSEMIQVVSSLYLAGWNGSYISLPPKGLNELDSLKWAVKNGVCQGVLDLGNLTDEVKKIPGIKIVTPSDLEELKSKKNYLPKINEILGDQRFFDKIQISS